MGRGKHLTAREKEFVLNLFQFFEDEEKRGQKARFKSIREKVAAALKLSLRTVDRVKARSACSDESDTDQTVVPQKVSEHPVKYDDFTVSVIRRRALRCFREKDRLTLPKITDYLNVENEGITFTKSTVWRTLKKLGFTFKKTPDNKKSIFERHDVVAARHNFLRKLKSYRNEGYSVVYVDETWVNENDTLTKAWVGPEEESGVLPPSGKGRRLIILHAGNKELGFLQDCALIFKAQKGEGDYHHEMNTKVFMNWFLNVLLPSLTQPSVIILDNASYHNQTTTDSKCPTSNTRKADMIEWLVNRGIHVDDTLLKPEVYQLVKMNKPKPVYETDVQAGLHGHFVLRTPIRHCELNAIELIWAQVKGYVKANNKTFKLHDVETLFHEGCDRVTAADWARAVEHTEAVEKEYWKTDGVMDTEINPVVFFVSDGEETDDSDIEDPQ